MGEIVTSIATKLVEYQWDPISRHARYLVCFKQFNRELKEAEDKLKERLEEVKEHERQVTRKSDEIMLPVKNWLNHVETVLEDAQKLQQEVDGGNSCFNVSLRYSLAKQMKDKAKKMKFKQNSKFEPFSQLIQLPGISTQFSSKEIMDFKSRELTYNSLLDAIKDDKNKMVGLNGMGGSGKTTLAIVVGERVKQLKLFDKVIKVVVSRPLNVRNIQDQIKEETCLQFEEKTESAVAQRLLIGLANMKILIILDDVWSDLRLQEIGIPLGENCRILLTTRLQNVCKSMHCEREFELSVLTKKEAWALLKMHANTTSCNDSLNEFDGVGSEILDECKGLPIAIVTVGRALRGKGIVEWKSTLNRLRNYIPLDIEESSRCPYACLKLSYDYLPNDLTKQLYLLCSMFPEDQKIHMEDLIRFAKGTLKFHEEIAFTMENARIEILVGINKLLDSCLLMHADKKAHVKMHDLVRDVALWISKKHNHEAILVDSHVVSRMLAEKESLKETKVISLWNLENNFRLSNQLHCPTLEIMLFHWGFIEDFGGIEELKVLALVKSSFQWTTSWWPWSRWIKWSMPQPLNVSSLIKLHTICLRGIELGDISFLCQLKTIEIIDLRGSQLNELPDGIVDMKQLKILDVFDCEIEKSPVDVIESCKQLEELYFWDKKSAILENFSLSGLRRYVIYDSTCNFSRVCFFWEVENFVPFITYFDACMETLRALCIQGFKVSALNLSMKDLILRANYLWLDNCMWDLVDINFEMIKHLVVSKSQEKRFIIDKQNIVETKQVFSHLITLTLVDMERLEQVFQDSSISCSLPMLQELCIERCPELRTCIFTSLSSQVAHGDHCLPLPKLERLTLQNLSKLREINIFEGGLECPQPQHKNGNERINVMNSELCSLDLYNLVELEYIWNKSPTQSVISLYRLENVTLRKCSKLRNIFTLTIIASLPELRTLLVYECEELEGIFCEETLKSLSSSSAICLPKLKEIDIWSCKRVRRVLSYSMASQHCPSLERIIIDNCSELEGFVKGCRGEEGEVGDHHQHQNLFPQLKQLSLKNLPKLENIFTVAIVISLPELMTLKVKECEEWEGIFCEEVLKSLSSSSNVCFPKLEEIYVSSCKRMRRVLSCSMASQHCPSLERIIIENCSELERLVDEETTHGDHHLPLPKLKQLSLGHLPKLRDINIFGGGLECSQPQHKDENGRIKVINSELCYLKLHFLVELEYIWNKGPTQSVINLHRLTEINLWCCLKLRNIFTVTIVTSLPELRKLRVYDCQEWEGIFCEEALKSLSSSSNVCFPKLKEIEISSCKRVRNVLSYSMASQHCPSLETLSISDCEELEWLVDEEEAAHGDHCLRLPKLKQLMLTSLPKLRDINICFPKLEKIRIDDCNRVRRVLSYSLASHCPSLEKIEIEDCSQLEGLVLAYEGEQEVVDHHQRLFPKLNHLELTKLPMLREIYPGYEFNHVYGTIQIQDCPNISNRPLQYN